MDNAITAFFDERKAAWLKKNVKASMSDVDIKEKEQECEQVFALKNWLPNAASRAGQMSISTHPCTFSHPSARKNKNGYASSVIAKSKQANDGFLRSGNVNIAADALGNAAALDVYKFLTLEMADGEKLLTHFEQDSQLAKALVERADGVDYTSLKQGFLAMTTSDGESLTSSKIKQIYFPVHPQREQVVNKEVGEYKVKEDESDGDAYHQLSVLTASGMVFELRKRLDAMRFGDEVKEARDCKKNNLFHQGYREIYDLTTIGYGGTKPQNISVLNNQNGGKAHLLMSMPPKLKRRDIHFPSVNFFTQSVRYSACAQQFRALHALYSKDHNNMHVRAQRDNYYESIIHYIIDIMWLVRGVEEEQYTSETSHLSKAQTTWLCKEGRAQRETTDDWLDEICRDISQFLFHGYDKVLGKKAIKLGKAEYQHMQDRVLAMKEALR